MQLADYVCSLSLSSVPASTVEKTKQAILDTIGCVVAGSVDRVARIVAEQVEGYAPEGPCTVFGRSRSTGPEQAALVNGTAAHVLELDDGHRPSDNHLGGVVVPAGLAVAEAADASGP